MGNLRLMFQKLKKRKSFLLLISAGVVISIGFMSHTLPSAIGTCYFQDKIYHVGKDFHDMRWCSIGPAGRMCKCSASDPSPANTLNRTPDFRAWVKHSQGFLASVYCENITCCL